MTVDRSDPRSAGDGPAIPLGSSSSSFSDYLRQHAPHLLPDFEAHWRREIGDTFNLSPVPAFVHLWWTQYAIARDPVLEAHLTDLQARAAKEDDPGESTRLLAEYSRLRALAAAVEPGA